MIEEFIDSVLIIDDNEEEIKDLKNILVKKDIWVTCYNPPKEKQEIDQISKPFKNRKLVFLDLRIDETKQTIENISVIIRPLLRKIIARDFGNYGIVMWTKHERHIAEFKEKIQKDVNDYQLPLFVIQMDKSKYLRDGFDNILIDLETRLQKNTAANFFINWSNLIQKGKDKAITSIFELIPDYQKQDKNLEFLLFKMAQNYTGIPFDKIDDAYPLSVDAIKAFNDLLISEINSISETNKLKLNKNEYIFILSSEDKGWFIKNKLTDAKKDLMLKKISKEEDAKIKWSICDDFTKKEKKDEILNTSKEEIINLFSALNSKLLIDEVNIKQDKIVPGNVYEIKDISSNLKYHDLPENAIPVIIEMTPPCDFSNNKTKYPRALSGFIIELSKDLKTIDTYKSEKFYSEFWPVKINNTVKIVIFNFAVLGFVKEDKLKNEKRYKLLFRVKDKLFADILQKMSAYTARLGLPIIR